MLVHLSKPLYLYGDDDSDLTQSRTPRFYSAHLFRDFAKQEAESKSETPRGKDKDNGRRRKRRETAVQTRRTHQE